MLTLCDAIAIKLLPRNRVIAGVGNELRVFEEGDSTGRTLEWKLKNKIHGLDVTGAFILIYGEREFMILEYVEESTLICKGKISDWISSGKLFLNGKTLEILLITGHSVALKLKWSDAEKLILEGRSSCVDKSTIYCSTVVGKALLETTVFAGTAFGELFAWKPQFKELKEKHLIHDPVLWRISGHNGVIFSIDVNLKHSFITTTSDDRSVRFYTISKDQSSEETHSNLETAQILPIRSVYGHNARVFKAKIVQNDGKPFVISAGEDSYICVWDINGDLIFKRRHHFGATIWDFEFDEISKTLFSTSSDGNICSHVISDYFLPIQSVEQKHNFPNGEYLAKISYVRKKLILAITSQNRFLYYKDNTWHVVNSYSGYKCTLLVVSDNLIALTGYKIVSLFEIDDNDKIEKIYEKPIVSNLIRSFCFLSNAEAVVCDEKGECKYSDDRFENSMQIILPHSKEPWITSALKHGSFLLLNTRQGNLLLYKHENLSFSFISTIKHIHGRLGVTYMQLSKECSDYFLVQTVGHDSTVKTLKINTKSNEFFVAKTKTVPIAWVEKTYNTSENRNYVIGFNDNHFLVWCFESDVVFQIACGGGHRCWNLYIDELNNSIEFIFIKNRLLHRATAKLNTNILNKFQIPYFSWHIKLCNTIESFPLSDGKYLFVSGGEDNLLKFSIFSTNKLDQMQTVDNTFRHISSIKSIAIVDRKTDLLIFSVGGRAQICVSRFDLKETDIEEHSEFMLKSTDMERKYQRDVQEVDFDPETRFMSISIVENLGKYDLYLGCSDGYIRRFIYKNGTISLAEALLYNRCILHTKTFKLGKKIYLVSAATDGMICLWELEKFNELLKPIFNIQHHESGVNSIDLHLQENRILIVSGGDDQNIVYSEINIQNNTVALIFKKSLSIHSAQVNGVKFSPCAQFLYSTSIDQTVCVICLKTMQLVNKVSTCIADIKGLNVLRVDHRIYCVIYGWGIQIFDL